MCPIYDVICTNIECNHEEEVLVPFSEKDLQVCPKCATRMTAIPSIPGNAQFKGDTSFSVSGGKGTTQ